MSDLTARKFMWKNININKNNIKVETERSYLIAMPHNSDYDGYQFWHPAKLVREGRHRAAISISYTDDFEFKLVKYGKGKWNSRDVIATTTISAEAFEAAFGITNENIVAPTVTYKNEYETHKPEPLEAENKEALEELKDE